jgi:hypothetical protein
VIFFSLPLTDRTCCPIDIFILAHFLLKRATVL